MPISDHQAITNSLHKTIENLGNKVKQLQADLKKTTEYAVSLHMSLSKFVEAPPKDET